MATTIRLTRMGKKKRPFYRLVVLDSRKRRDGAYLANVGYYNPFVDPPEINLHNEEIIAWLRKGATVSGTVRSLLKSQGILYHFSLLRQGMPTEEIATKMSQWRETSDARLARLAQKRNEAARVAVEVKAKAEQEKAEAAAAEETADGDAAGGEESTETASAEEVTGADSAAEPAATDEPEQAEASAAQEVDSKTESPDSDTAAAAEATDKKEES